MSVDSLENLLQFGLGCSFAHHRDDQKKLPELNLSVVVHVVKAEDVGLQLRLEYNSTQF